MDCRKRLSLFAIALLSALASGCGETDKINDKIVDGLDKDGVAKVTFVNISDEQMGFFVKNEAHKRDVFNSDFKIGDIDSQQRIGPRDVGWLNTAKRTYFGVNDTKTEQIRYTTTRYLKDKSEYWAVGSNLGILFAIDIFEKSTVTQPDVYSVRIYSTEENDIINTKTGENLGTIEPGMPTELFTLLTCSELRIGETNVDLCAVGTPGNAYLVTLDASGLITILREND